MVLQKKAIKHVQNNWRRWLKYSLLARMVPHVLIFFSNKLSTECVTYNDLAMVIFGGIFYAFAYKMHEYICVTRQAIGWLKLSIFLGIIYLLKDIGSVLKEIGSVLVDNSFHPLFVLISACTVAVYFIHAAFLYFTYELLQVNEYLAQDGLNEFNT